MMSVKKIRLLLFVAALVITGIIGAANTPVVKHWWQKRKEAVSTEASDQKDPLQQALVQELMGWLRPFDTTNTSYYLNGLLTAIDKTDSANAMIEVPYTVCKNGQQLYLRMAQTEAINSDALYLFVDHAAQKMLLGKARTIAHSNSLAIGDLYDYIRSEGYTFTKTNNSTRLWTISMQNPNHASNKELTVVYDSVSSRAVKIFMRQTEVTDPMNADKEKWITLAIKDWNDDPNAAQYIEVKKFIQKKQDAWECTPEYKNYELIIR